MPRGGRRNGSPGVAYGNRSDLNAGQKPLPVQAATGQQYGQATAQMNAQKTLPMAGTPMPATPSAPTPGQPGTPDPLLPQANPVYAGDHGDPLRPSQRPNEPVTAGLPVGAGPGPEILAGTVGAPMVFNRAKDLIQSLAQTNPSPALQTLAMYAGNSL